MGGVTITDPALRADLYELVIGALPEYGRRLAAQGAENASDVDVIEAARRIARCVDFLDQEPDVDGRCQRFGDPGTVPTVDARERLPADEPCDDMPNNIPGDDTPGDDGSSSPVEIDPGEFKQPAEHLKSAASPPSDEVEEPEEPQASDLPDRLPMQPLIDAVEARGPIAHTIPRGTTDYTSFFNYRNRGDAPPGYVVKICNRLGVSVRDLYPSDDAGPVAQGDIDGGDPTTDAADDDHGDDEPAPAPARATAPRDDSDTTAGEKIDHLAAQLGTQPGPRIRTTVTCPVHGDLEDRVELAPPDGDLDAHRKATAIMAAGLHWPEGCDSKLAVTVEPAGEPEQRAQVRRHQTGTVPA